MAVVGNTAYVGEFFARRLTILDISDRRAPVLRGQLAVGPEVTGLAASGSYVYLTGLGGHLQIVDVVNPTAPLSTSFLAGSGYAIAASGTFAYLVTYEGATGNKLKIFNVTNPVAPALQSETGVGTGFSNIIVIGTTAYLCSSNVNGGGNWLRLYDISNPASPVLTGSVSLGAATYRCMTTDGTYAYVGVGDGPGTSRLSIYNVSNPAAAPVAMGSLQVNDIPATIAVTGSTVYLTFYVGATSALILDTIDVSDVTAPSLSDYTSLGSGDGGIIEPVDGYLFIPGQQFDVYAVGADQATASLRVSGGLMVDSVGRSNGGLINGITFGVISGEGISSRRTVPGGNPYGIDFYTAFTNRMAITNGGRVGVGVVEPQYTLHVNGSVAGVGAYANVSDGRYKQRLTPIPNAVERVAQLHGVRFEWKRDDRPDLELPEGQQLGLIAQEVEGVFPEAVSTADDGTKSIAYSTLIPVLVEAVKEQHHEIASLRAALKRLLDP